jgi:formyltetrahydrofolate hydrolase
LTTELGEHSRDEKDIQRYTARLLIGCADRPGIVAAVSGFLFERGANIVSSHQYSSDPSGGRFFMRTEFFLPESPDAQIQSADTHVQAGGRERLQAEIREGRCRALRDGLGDALVG